MSSIQGSLASLLLACLVGCQSTPRLGLPPSDRADIDAVTLTLERAVNAGEWSAVEQCNTELKRGGSYAYKFRIRQREGVLGTFGAGIYL